MTAALRLAFSLVLSLLLWLPTVPSALANAEEPAGSWELGRVALVLGIWCVVGLALCVRTFRWQDRGDG